MSSVTKVGLEDVVVWTSDICFIDGREGRLVYRGFDVDDLAEHSSFGEIVFLLWHGELPQKPAHVLEQHANNRLIRPRSDDTGPTRECVPLDRR